MGADWSRRGFLEAAAGVASGLIAPQAKAQSGGLLAKLQAQKSVKIGLANQPPYNMLNPDGTVDGVAPVICRVVMERLGIPKLEAFAVPYGELIPGLQAGRWDMVGGALTISKARCEQVQFSDPVVFEGASMAYVPAVLQSPPKTIKEAGERGLKVGVLAGGYLLPAAQRFAKDKANVSQFNDNAALLDGLLTKRIDVALASHTAIRDLRAQRANAYEIVYPIADDIPHGSGLAFRKTDNDLFDAFQAELRKMKKSGEAEKIITGFGIEIPPGGLELTGVMACAAAT